MLSTKIRPFARAVEIVDHEEAAAQQVLAQLRRLRVGQVPLTDFDGVEPRPIEDVVAVLEIDGLLDRAGVDDAQAADQRRDVAIAARVIDGPARAAELPLTAPAERRIHETREHPLGGLAEIGRQLEIVVLDPGVLAKRQGIGERRADET